MHEYFISELVAEMGFGVTMRKGVISELAAKKGLGLPEKRGY